MDAHRFIAGLSLASLLASGVVSGAESDPVAPLELAISTAESRLQKGDLQAAESHYREALFEGWLLMGALERLERRLPEAREAVRNASHFPVEGRPGLQSLATAHLQMGEAARALEILTALAGKDPRDGETRRLLARALAADGQIEAAARKLAEAGATASDDPELAFLVATDFLTLKKVDAAEPLFAQVLKARPIPQTHVLIGRAYRDAGEYDRARAQLRAALEQDPSVRRAHYYLGMVVLADARTGPDRLEKATAEFREELKLAPEDPPANDQLGLALLEAERPAEALPAFETAVHGQARSLYVYHLGRCQLALARPSEAASTLRRALELAQERGGSESEIGKIHYQLGLALRKLGAAQEAATHLAEARRLAGDGTPASGEGLTPGSSDAEASPLAEIPLWQRQGLKRRVTSGLARAYFNLGVLQAQSRRSEPAAERFARAAALLEQAARIDPDFPQVQSSLGVSYFNARQFDKATGPLTRALAVKPDDGLKRMLAISWLNTEAWEKAAALLQDDPERKTDASLESAYGLALLRSGRGAEAEKVLGGLLAEKGDSAELLVLLGQAHAQQADDAAAIRVLQKALQLNAAVAEAHGTLGIIHMRQGRLGEAEQALRAELEGHPRNSKAQQTLAAVLEAARRPEEALPLLHSVLESKPDSADARYLLGKILLARGAATEAVEHLEVAVRLAPGNADVHDQLGRAYEKLGRKDLARQQFKVLRDLKARR